jgi:hypothetical protein
MSTTAALSQVQFYFSQWNGVAFASQDIHAHRVSAAQPHNGWFVVIWCFAIFSNSY